MKQSEIKTECELIIAEFKSLEDRFQRLRSICKHPNTHEGIYSWRVGVFQPAIICSDCDKVISTEWQKLRDINREEI